MQQKGEEPDPLFYNRPLSRLLNWNRWWHIVAKTIQLSVEEEDLGNNRVTSQVQERKLHGRGCSSQEALESREPGSYRTWSILLQVGEEGIKVRRYCMHQPPCQCLDWQTTLILRMVPPMRKAKRKQSVRDHSTASRLPYEYDQVMGITQVGSGEAEGFDEGLDLEYHDAAEDPNVLEPEGYTREPVLSRGGCGSSSLRECIELLNNLERKAPATCHSGPKMENRSGPPQVMSPNVEESPACTRRGQKRAKSVKYRNNS